MKTLLMFFVLVSSSLANAVTFDPNLTYVRAAFKNGSAPRKDQLRLNSSWVGCIPINADMDGSVIGSVGDARWPLAFSENGNGVIQVVDPLKSLVYLGGPALVSYGSSATSARELYQAAPNWVTYNEARGLVKYEWTDNYTVRVSKKGDLIAEVALAIGNGRREANSWEPRLFPLMSLAFPKNRAVVYMFCAADQQER